MKSRPPSSRIGRLVSLGRVGLRAGAGFLGSGEGAAQFAAKQLATMRGIATKVGQMAAYIDGVVPEGQRESYQKYLKGLLDQTTASPFEDVRQAIESDFGQPLERLFSSFEEAPLASASIGQVHRARLKDGLDVAVKVQHPGIADVVAADLNNAGLLESALAIAGTRKFESKRIMEEIRARFTEELDYALEAERQRYFRQVNADTPAVLVPRVIDALSSKRVLTMEFVTGVSLDEMAKRSEDERRRAIETMWRFVYRTSLNFDMFNADPHPGNFVFCDDGRVAFLDFGCVQKSPKGSPLAREIHKAAGRQDEAAFRRLAPQMLETRGGRFEEMAVAYLREAFVPQFSSPFTIDRNYVSGLVKRFRDSGYEAVK